MMIGELAALGAALSWTVSAILYRQALRKAKPASANIVRCACTGTVLVMFLVVIGKSWVLTSLPADAVVLAFASGVIGLGFGDTLYMVSLDLVGVTRAVPITCTYPLFTLLWAVLLVGEPITLPVVLGAVAIVLGIWLLGHGESTVKDEKHGKNMTRGVVFALATAIIWSVSITMIDLAVTIPKTSDLDHALAVNTLRVLAVALSLLVAAPVIDRNLGFLKMPRRTVAALVLGGIVALGLGWFFLTLSFMNTLESRAVPISSTTPLFSTLAGIVFLREKVTAKSVAGSIIIVIGIFLIFII